jgi:ATP-dependent helicase/nuclease subunit A
MHAETATSGAPTAASLTEQQRRAVVTRDVSVVLSSGAGCGKTHVLTERYLSHLRDDGAEVNQVVAITFTDRAAREMRRRIRQAIAGHLRTTADEKEAVIWARHLRNLETAPISTIHAFCATILRQYAVVAGLDPRFDVLEEVLSLNLEQEALEISLQRLLTAETQTGDDLRRLVPLFGWRIVVEGIQYLVRSRDEARWRNWLAASDDKIIEGWHNLARRALLPQYVESLIASRPRIVRCLSLLRQHPPRPGPMKANVQTLFDKLPRLAEARDLAAAVEELAEAAKVGRIGIKAWPDRNVYEAIKKAFEDFREEIRGQKLEAFTETSDGVDEAIAVGRRFLRVAMEAVQVFRERKRLHGVVDFNDLLLLTRDLLRDRSDVRAALQERYRFLLIDELQDTDPVQMELIGTLCGAGQTAGKLFAVGDPNQSIYRFRGAEVRLFQDLRNQIDHEGRQYLTLNFRSLPGTLDFTNALLGHRLADYEPLRAHRPSLSSEPCVEFLWSPLPESATAADGRVVEADWIARRIISLVDRGAARWGDVVVLFRAMTSVHLYEAALRKYRIDYYLVGGRAFFAQQEIYDILNLLRALENPQDGVSLAGTLRSPFCCLSDEALFVLGRHREGLWAGLNDWSLDDRLPADQRAPVERARRFLERWRGLKDRLSIARLLGAVFADSGYDAAMRFEFLGERKLANLWKLVDLARTFDRSGLFGLADFIARLDDLVANQAREEQAATQPENADVVRLMSIHQAKGLEFPIVILADMAAIVGGTPPPAVAWNAELGCVVRPPTGEEPAPFSDLGWRLWQARDDMEQWHEGLRTLYVACTRAENYLILSAALPENYQPGNAWMTTLTERFDLASGQCLVSGFEKKRRPAINVFDRACPVPESSGSSDRRPVVLPQLPDATGPRRWEPIVPVADRRASGGDARESRRRGKKRAASTAFQSDLFSELDEPDESAATGASAVEPIVRQVLAGWDCRDPDGWQSLLKAFATDRAVEAEAQSWLERFAATELCREFAAAVERHHDIEYCVDLAEHAPEGMTPPLVHGNLDCLWRDVDGAWRLAICTGREAPSAASQETAWRERLRETVLAAEAVRRQTGDWPCEVVLYFWGSGAIVRKDGRRLSAPRILKEIAVNACPR